VTAPDALLVPVRGEALANLLAIAEDWQASHELVVARALELLALARAGGSDEQKG
jgi:hypothetical protein